MRKILLTIIPALLMTLSPASWASVGPLGFEPELIIYQNGLPVGIKLAPHVVKTIDDCKDVLQPVVSQLATKGIQAVGACVPIPPAPSADPVPQKKDPTGLSPESFQMAARVGIV